MSLFVTHYIFKNILIIVLIIAGFQIKVTMVNYYIHYYIIKLLFGFQKLVKIVKEQNIEIFHHCKDILLSTIRDMLSSRRAKAWTDETENVYLNAFHEFKILITTLNLFFKNIAHLLTTPIISVHTYSLIRVLEKLKRNADFNDLLVFLTCTRWADQTGDTFEEK